MGPICGCVCVFVCFSGSGSHLKYEYVYYTYTNELKQILIRYVSFIIKDEEKQFNLVTFSTQP